jgi:hypothetical protein
VYRIDHSGNEQEVVITNINGEGYVWSGKAGLEFSSLNYDIVLVGMENGRRRINLQVTIILVRNICSFVGCVGESL